MRTAYHEELARFAARLADLARLAESALGQATKALLDNDETRAGKVIREGARSASCTGCSIPTRSGSWRGSSRWRASCAGSSPACG
jgi:hypothetical protein